MHCADIRQKFVEYYQNLGFQWLPRAPMLHPSIPMSFVMSAGLVQVETSLANTKNRSGDKFVLVQDCFRHFDLDKIGKDNVHLSLFEMPAAFVFGEDPQRNVIKYIWDLITNVLGIDPQKLWVSYFKGDMVEGHYVPEDTQTYQTWRDVGVPEDRLIGLGCEHNYWVQGGGFDNGGSEWRKCGANTELFYDLGQKKACSMDCHPGCRCGRFVEFSNSLFVTHHLNTTTNEFTPMDDPFTETVIGTERVAMILQNVPSVFETNAYRPIIDMIHLFVTPDGLPTNLIRESEWVIADHLRALYVLIADDAPPPGKNGRERIMKLLIRGIITRQNILGIGSKNFLPILHPLINDFLTNNVKNFHDILSQKITGYVEKEAQRFRNTIEQGYSELEKMLKKNQGKTLVGSQIVSLEKQYGLPYILTAAMLQKRGLEFEATAYFKALETWKQESSNNRK